MDKMFDRLQRLHDAYTLYHEDYFLRLLAYLAFMSKRGQGNKEETFESEQKPRTLNFRSQAQKVPTEPEHRSVYKLLTPPLVNYLNDKFLAQKRWAWEKLMEYYRANKFCELYKKWDDLTLLQPKRDLIDLLKAEYLYMNGLGASNCDLYKLLRRSWVRLVCKNMVPPSRVYRILYLIKMTMMHKTIAYQRFIRELIRKWRFSAFIQNVSRWTTVDDMSEDEEIFCEKVKKRYVFQPMNVLLEKDARSYFFSSGIEIEDSGEGNEDYYVDRDIQIDTQGKYKQETSKSASRKDASS